MLKCALAAFRINWDGMMKQEMVADVCTALNTLICALVANPDSVSVVSLPYPNQATMIQIKTAEGQDTGKVIGKQGRTIRAIRTLVQAIAKEQGQHILLDVATASLPAE